MSEQSFSGKLLNDLLKEREFGERDIEEREVGKRESGDFDGRDDAVCKLK